MFESQTVLALGVLLENMVLSHTTDFCCCMKELVNGSVSFTLNSTIPKNWSSSWIKDGEVIVDEDGGFHEDYVVCQTVNGYVLRQNYHKVLCKLESPEDGVSKEIPCTAACEPRSLITAPGGSISPFNTGLITGLSVLFLLSLFLFFIYMWWQRRRRRGNVSDVEMQPVNVQDRDQDDPDHQDVGVIN